jgi:hypothetical protein
VLPPFNRLTGNLPPGVHVATWGEMVARYSHTPHRLILLAGCKAALDTLRLAGCRRAYIDGCFVTAKAVPHDFDVCWEIAGVDFVVLDQLDPVLLDWSNRRAAQKAKFGGELFIANASADQWGLPYLEFFQRDRDTGQPKGIVAIDLGGLP